MNLIWSELEIMNKTKLPMGSTVLDIIEPITNYLSEREHRKIEEARERTERERIRSALKAYTFKLKTDRMKYESYLEASLCDRMERYSMVKDFLDKNRGSLNNTEAFANATQLLISIINKEDIQLPEESFYNKDCTLNNKYLKNSEFEHLMLE